MGLCEFWSLGFRRFKYSVFGMGNAMTWEEKRRLLARLHNAMTKEDEKNAELGNNKDILGNQDPRLFPRLARGFGSAISLDSASSGTSIESV